MHISTVTLCTTQERDAAVKKAADVRTRMVDSKRASRKDISSLQDKLTKVHVTCVMRLYTGGMY